MFLNYKSEVPVKTTKFQLLDMVGELKAMPPVDFEFFIGALVANAPEIADKIQFAINTQFQELDND